jgi:hypothetical protein
MVGLPDPGSLGQFELPAGWGAQELPNDLIWLSDNTSNLFWIVILHG